MMETALVFPLAELRRVPESSFRQGLPESRAQGCETEQSPMVILAVCFGIAIHGFWIPAIPAGMTRFKTLVYNDECSA
jgi:hypothetical protein